MGWLGDVEKIEDGRTPRSLLHGKFVGVTIRGSPRKRWLQNVEQGVGRWMENDYTREERLDEGCKGGESPYRAVEPKKCNIW